MTTTGLKKLNFGGVLGHGPLPNDSQCPVCGWFDVTHPGLRQVLRDRTHGDEKLLGTLLYQAQCKCLKVEQKRQRDVALRWEQANLPHHAPRIFDAFEAVAGTGEMLDAAKLFATGGGPRCLVLVGSVGVGKSHMLEAICRAYLMKGKTARYELVSSFLDRLRSTYDDGSQEDITELMAWYERRGVLALDDLGMERNTEWAVEKLVAVVDGRLRNHQDLVVATNRTATQMRAYSERLASRLFGASALLGDVHVVEVRAPDYRAGS